jgi:ribosome biogenesis GTPase
VTFDGVVARVDLRGVVVLDDGGTLRAAAVPKRLQDPGARLGNAIVVGDGVTVREAVVESIAPRRNRFERRAAGARARARHQILAANLDQVVVVAALAHPPLAEGLLDRFAVTAEWCGLPLVLVFTKCDLVSEAEIADARALYARTGYPTHAVVAKEGRGLAELQAALAGRRSLVVGHSGVGKSTLLNALVPGLDLRIGEVNAKTGRGRHTTTASTLVRLDPGPPATEVIDTPGVRTFGLPPDLSARSLARLFPEWRDQGPCRFADCSHLDEPGCALVAARAEGAIGGERHRSYRVLYEELSGAPERRLPRGARGRAR